LTIAAYKLLNWQYWYLRPDPEIKRSNEMIRKPLITALGISFLLSLTYPSILSAHSGGKGMNSQTGNNNESDFPRGPGAGFSELDSSGDGLVSFAEFQAAEHPRFNKRDSNGDGKITLDELQSSINRQASQKGSEKFKELDQNHDGVITRDEMLQQAFSRIDYDGDGSLSETELKSHGADRHKKKRMREHARSRIDTLDIDQDGLISREEFMASDHRRFSHMDVNADGVITLPEMEEVADGKNGDRLAEHFAKMDVNGDEMVTKPEMLERVFSKMDRDGDNLLTPTEIKRHVSRRQRGDQE
jgi:Ca2+-binding EF-hand superfamily protein